MIHYSTPGKDIGRESQGFSAIDIPFPSKTMNVAEILLTSRYPATGYALNQQSEMIVRILEGSTAFWCEGEQVILGEGATALVQANKRYCWIPEDFVRLYAVSSPPWTPEQHVKVPD